MSKPDIDSQIPDPKMIALSDHHLISEDLGFRTHADSLHGPSLFLTDFEIRSIKSDRETGRVDSIEEYQVRIKDRVQDLKRTQFLHALQALFEMGKTAQERELKNNAEMPLFYRYFEKNYRNDWLPIYKVVRDKQAINQAITETELKDITDAGVMLFISLNDSVLGELLERATTSKHHLFGKDTGIPRNRVVGLIPELRENQQLLNQMQNIHLDKDDSEFPQEYDALLQDPQAFFRKVEELYLGVVSFIDRKTEPGPWRDDMGHVHGQQTRSISDALNQIQGDPLKSGSFEHYFAIRGKIERAQHATEKIKLMLLLLRSHLQMKDTQAAIDDNQEKVASSIPEALWEALQVIEALQLNLSEIKQMWSDAWIGLQQSLRVLPVEVIASVGDPRLHGEITDEPDWALK